MGWLQQRDYEQGILTTYSTSKNRMLKVVIPNLKMSSSRLVSKSFVLGVKKVYYFEVLK